MQKTNEVIRKALKDNGIYQWQLAEEIGVSEYTLLKRLRKELSAEAQAEMLSVIEKLAKGE